MLVVVVALNRNATNSAVVVIVNSNSSVVSSTEAVVLLAVECNVSVIALVAVIVRKNSERPYYAKCRDIFISNWTFT